MEKPLLKGYLKSCNETEPLNETKCHKAAQKLTLESSILRDKVHFATSDTRVRRSKSEENRLTGYPKFEISWFAISPFDNRECHQAIVIRSRKAKKVRASKQASEQANKRLSEKRQKKTLRHERVERKGRLCYEIFIECKYMKHIFELRMTDQIEERSSQLLRNLSSCEKKA